LLALYVIGEMNIFYLQNDPKLCAQQHVDKHVVKMILEYAQLLSTAHRVLDGNVSVGKSNSGRKQTRYVLPDDRDSVLYNATHLNHPSAKWTRHSLENYQWLFRLWIELMREYHYRYGKIHASARLIPSLKNPPTNIPSLGFCAPWRAMPDEFKVDDTIQSYRNYYLGAKSAMFKWKDRPKPEWIV
jgi:hypothetical protein